MTTVAVLDYGMGNLRSVAKALEAAGASTVVTSHARELERADALCVPGQGIFGRCMTNLRAAGLDDFVAGWIRDGRPYLGICLGLQVLFERSEERPRGSRASPAGLGTLRGEVRRLPRDTNGSTLPLRIPHIGWNLVDDGEAGADHYYFDHSYAVHPADPSVVAGWCEHGTRFAAAVRSGSVYAVQFHPEKSGRAGIDLLTRWLGEAA